MLAEIQWWGGGGLLVKALLVVLILSVAWLCLLPDSFITLYSRFKYWLLEKIGQHPVQKHERKMQKTRELEMKKQKRNMGGSQPPSGR